MNGACPLSILIGALGGEGGGVLAGWLTRAAEASGFPVQRTSIPGVAQRTGATTYYVEIFPVRRDTRDAKELVMALSPVPGHIDLMVASELLEAGRAVQSGAIDPARTTVIASNHRVFTVLEKSAMTDGRFDHDALTALLQGFAKRAILFDMEAAARASGTAISAVMLGAIAGSGVVPLPRAAFEEAIRASGIGVEASLRGFAAGYDVAAGSAAPAMDAAAHDARDPRVHASTDAAVVAGVRFPPDVRPLVEAGYARQLDYQNRRHADLFLERVERLYAAERAAGGTGSFPVTAAVARFLALWMSYEDVIRVADLKSRASRMRRVHTEVSAKPGDIVRVIEFMKPGVEEWCAVLPTSIAQRLGAWAHKRRKALSVGLHIRTDALHGFLLLRALAGLRWWRPYTSRYAEEQALIERWLHEIEVALGRHVGVALEIALCGRLIKGYGDTQARGKRNFTNILDTLSQPIIGSDAERAGVIRQAREAAMADPDGKQLSQALSAHGFAPPPPRPIPIVWHKKARTAAER